MEVLVGLMLILAFLGTLDLDALKSSKAGRRISRTKPVYRAVALKTALYNKATVRKDIIINRATVKRDLIVNKAAIKKDFIINKAAVNERLAAGRK